MVLGRPKRIFAAIAVALAAGTAFAVAPASPASAHDSTYCGHSINGYFWSTQFVRSYTLNLPSGPDLHQHVYDHYERVSLIEVRYRHTRERTCSFH